MLLNLIRLYSSQHEKQLHIIKAIFGANPGIAEFSTTTLALIV
jgi:phage tail protein X